MNIEIINNKNIWDDFIAKYGKWSLFQSYLWGEVLLAQNIRIERIGMFDGNKLVGIAQIAIIPARRGRFLHIRHGPIFVDKNLNELKKYWIFLLDYLKKFANQESAWFIRISPMIENSPENLDFFKMLHFNSAPIHAMDAEYCWVLDLTSSEEELLKNMRKSTRYSIKQAEKYNLDLYESNKIDDFNQLYNQTAQRHKFVKHRGLKEEFEIFSKNNQAKLFFVKQQKQVLAAAIILFFGKEAVYHHGASIYSKVPASFLLQWEAIKMAKKRGCEIYNFWGIAPTDNKKHPWQGLTLFKKGFGGQEKQFLHALDLPVSHLYPISYTIEYIRKISKGY